MSFKHIPTGEHAPQKVNAIVEIPRNSQTKYEYNEILDCIEVDRVLFSSQFYPIDYGFIPQTRSLDGDQLDIMVLISTPLMPGSLIKVRPVGMLDMIDGGAPDAKIIAVADCDPRVSTIQSIEDISESRRNEIENFFATYKLLEKKEIEITGWKNKEAAYAKINEAIERFKNEG
ncbi:inorganic diphosphatase [bacterium]|jgi:inorganic pyrophosphatase|nr:inorganic diphosphatase [bacterium]MBT3903903.1 inorganic diphosphatase [bacterium]MBT4577447.1 inorganic diphosphatase [bacterium]MBT5345968.1 inorganic diphosphatase [bacterium]MBT6130754.1 inorganic diphosphatase [bacterium]